MISLIETTGGLGAISVRERKDDGTLHRYSLTPRENLTAEDIERFTSMDDVQLALDTINSFVGDVWTQEVIDNYKAFMEAQDE